MPQTEENLIRVLALCPNSTGFGFVVLESGDNLLCWEAKHNHSREQNSESLAKLRKLLQRWQPSVLVIEDARSAARRSWRIRHLLQAMAEQARASGIAVRRVDRQQARAQLGGGSKDRTARQIAQRLPDLADCLPPVRKAYMTEPAGMAIFEAAGMALYYFDMLKI